MKNISLVFFDYFERRIIKHADFLFAVGEARKDARKILNLILTDEQLLQPHLKSGFVFAGSLEKVRCVDRIIDSYNYLPLRINQGNKFRIFGEGVSRVGVHFINTSMIHFRKIINGFTQ